MKIKTLCAAILAAVLSVTLLTACSDAGGRLQQTSDIANGTVIGTVTVGDSTVEWVKYTDPDNYFTAMVPKGWQVRTNDLYNNGASSYSGMTIMFLSPDSSIGVTYTDYAAYKSSVFTAPTMEAVLRNLYFNSSINDKYATLAIQSNTSSGQDISAGLSNDARGNYITLSDSATIHFTVHDDEGEISGSIYKYLTNEETYYVKDCLMYLTSANQLEQWRSVLQQIRTSLNFTTTYQQRFQQNQSKNNNGGAVAGAYSIGNGTVGGTTGGIGFDMSDSYAARQKSQDIQNEKFRDYILGNERMQDNSTGAIYNTDPSFYQDYQDQGGERYSPITDDQYLEDTSGTIGW